MQKQPPLASRTQKVTQKSQQKFFLLGLILRELDAGRYPTQISKLLNRSRQLISYHIRRSLLKYGYVRKLPRTNVQLYELTEKGQILLARHETFFSSLGRVPRFHHLAFRYEVLRGVAGLERLLPLRQGQIMRHGIIQVDGKMTFEDEVFSIRRWHSQRSGRDWLIVYGPSLYAREPWKALSLTSMRIHDLAREIQRRYHIALSDPELFQRPEFAYENDPVAKLWYLVSGANVKTESGSIDASEGPPEVEFTSLEDAEEYLHMPRRIKGIEKAINLLIDLIAKQREGMSVSESEKKKVAEDLRRYLI